MTETLELRSLESEVTKRFGELEEDKLGSQMFGLATILDCTNARETPITEEQYAFACQALDLLHSQQATSYEQARDMLISGASATETPGAPTNSSIAKILDDNAEAMAGDVSRVIGFHRNYWSDSISTALFTLLEQKVDRMNIQAQVDAIIQDGDLGKPHERLLERLGLPLPPSQPSNPKQLSGS